MTSRAFPLYAAALAWSAFGCGSSDDDPSEANCAKVAACGGDVSGKWRLNHACYLVLEQPDIGFCKEATATVEVTSASGSFEFDAHDKGSFTRELDLEATVHLRVPVSCKTVPSGTLTCEDLSGSTASGDLSCTTEANGDCSCQSPEHPMLEESGTYIVSGNELQTSTGNVEFCAKGSRLTLRPTVEMGMGIMGTAQTLLQTTYDKQ